MNKTVMIGILAGVAYLTIGAPFAVAHDRSGVNWSVTIGPSYPPPAIYSPPPVVYVPAQPVYVQPYPSYVQPHPSYVLPQPIYIQPAPVVRYGRIDDDNHQYRHSRSWHGDHEQRHFRSHGPTQWRD